MSAISSSQQYTGSSAGGEMKFWTRNSSSITEKVRLHANGILAASAGIALGSGLANTAANTLDDYEEGTWTPTYDGSTSATGVTYSVRNGSYTKIGNTVTVSCNCVLTNKGTVVGVSRISGLPFAGNNSPAFHVISPMFGNLSLASDGTEQGTGAQYAVNSFVYLFYTNIGGALTQMTPTQINNNSDFHFSLTYMTNS
jgi:hypothetical protein